MYIAVVVQPMSLLYPPFYMSKVRTRMVLFIENEIVLPVSRGF